MSTCPVRRYSMSLGSSSPSSSPSNSPIARLRSSSKPSSPKLINRVPNIAAHSTPPSSPAGISSTMRFSMSATSPPPSPGCRKISVSSLTQVNALTSSLTVTPPTPRSTTSGPAGSSNNSRVHPVAQRSVRSGGKRKLGPGCGLLDWIRLCRKTDMASNGGKPRPVTTEELAKHDKEDDAWTAIRGKVYNLTYYMKFHPGGRSELMRGAGIDCTILFDEAHKWVNVESTLKSCYVGPLVAPSPTTQRKNSANIVMNNMAFRKDSLTTPSTLVFTEGVNKQAVSAAVRRTSMTLRNKTQAATACEEQDGSRQISPDSPVKSILGEPVPRKDSTASQEAASGNSATIRLALPPSRIRRTSEPHPRFDWVQSEKTVTLHVYTKNTILKPSDVTVDMNEKTLEASVFIYDWVFEIKLGLSHDIAGSQVNVNHGHVEIQLKKKKSSVHWDTVGTPLEGHMKLLPKSKRGTKYHLTHVEAIREVTHDTNLYTLRLPTGSYLSVPTGHHLSVRSTIDGEIVERKYTPVSPLELSSPRHGHQATPQVGGDTIELMVKLYRNGKMSSFLSKLREGDEVIVSDSEGSFDAAYRLKAVSDVLLIAAGSGFTPMVKILRDYLMSEVKPRPRITSNSEARGESREEEEVAPELPPSTSEPCNYEDKDKVDGGKLPKTARLLFANKRERDIMCRQELDHLATATSNKFKVTHILSESNGSWDGLKGRVCKTVLESCLPVLKKENQKSALVCVCGPDLFLTNISNMLVDMDFPIEYIQCFQ